jgi:hypothetical protein
MRAMVVPTMIASVGPRRPGSACNTRFIHPSGVVLQPGVPFSM